MAASTDLNIADAGEPVPEAVAPGLAGRSVRHMTTSVFVVLMRGVGVACQALVFVLLANGVAVADVGIFSAIYVFWALMRMLGPLGLDQIAMRDVAAATGWGDRAAADRISNFTLAAVAVIGFAVAVVAGLAMTAVSFEESGALGADVIIAAAVGALAYALMGVLAAQLRGYGRPISTQAVEIMLHGLSLMAIAAMAASGSLTLGLALIAQAGAAWIVVLVYGSLRLRVGIDLSQWPEKADRSATLRSAFQIWQALSLNGLAMRIPNYAALVVLGPAGSAILEIATRFGTLPTIFTDGVATTFSPLFARLHAGRRHDEYRHALALGSWLALLPALSALVALLTIGPWLLASFFPPSYAASYWPMVLVCGAATTNAAFGLASNAFIASGRQKIVRLYSGLQFVLLAVLSPLLALSFGPVGVAAAILLGVTVRDFGLARAIAAENRSSPVLDLIFFWRLKQQPAGGDAPA